MAANSLLAKFLPGAKLMHKMDTRKNEDLPRRSNSSSSGGSDTSRQSPLRSPPSQYPPLDLGTEATQGILEEELQPYNSISQTFVPHGFTAQNTTQQEFYSQTIGEQNNEKQKIFPQKFTAQGFISQNTISQKSKANKIDLKETEEDGIQYNTPKQRRTGLRTPKKNNSLKALENVNNLLDRPRTTATATTTKKKRGVRSAITDLIGDGSDDELAFSPVISKRAAIRKDIESHTKAFRDHFLVEKSDYFLPLLPENNYVRKLVEKHDNLSEEELLKLPTTTAYEEINEQPAGITATMKPYQLSGLSFMMYLHRNGLSGILGDEMGLGKTLQTLSLIQHLKETDPRSAKGRQQRPFLVVCPLSVLSSWMAEAKKWTPGLKVIRFHGPVAERNRLKKVVVGEIDYYGNLTAQARKKKNKQQRGGPGQRPFSLDTESEDENVGVDLVVTTYDSFKCEQAWFKTAFVWRYIVLDEGHTVKNSASGISKSLQGIKAEYRLILTGTPLQNNLQELWSLLAWLYPEVFVSKTNLLFEKSFNLSKGQFEGSVLDDSRRLLELIMLRRMKTSPGVELNLPPKTEVLLFVPLSPMQRFWYTRMITKADQGLLEELFKSAKNKEESALQNLKAIEAREAELAKMEADALKVLQDDSLIGTDAWKETKRILEQTVQREQENVQATGGKGKSAWQKLMNLLMQLRKVCNHPYQLQHAEPDPYETGEHLITASGKFIILEKLVNELVIKQKKKILIFSGFTKMLDLVEELLALRGGDGTSFRSMRIDGATCRARRNLGIRMFNDLSSDYRVMLISTRAGGLGINLATASDVVLLDQDWNPQITLQAEARAHRIGQKNPVTIYKLISQGTVEEQMMGRIQKKLYLSAKVTEAMQDIHTKFGSGKKRVGTSGDDDGDMPQLKTQELMTLVRRGASAISRPEIDVNEILSWDWETTVAKCKDQPADINVKKNAIPDAEVDEEAERKWLTEMERVESSVFDGKKLAKGVKSNRDLAQEYFNKEDRRVNKNTTVEIDGYAVSKESLNCGLWEAVPTMAGKDPTLKEPERAKKAAIEPQSHCQVCIDGGELHCCQGCPRAYHFNCLDREFQKKAKTWQFSCPQHECYDCAQNTQMAGGMLYRCRWCERAYCEDCLDFEKTKLIGNTLPELQLLGYPEMTQAFYIQCGTCTDNFDENPQNLKLCQDLEAGILHHWEDKFGSFNSFNREDSLQLGSMTDGTTAQASSVNTPIVIDDDDYQPSKKRKAVNDPQGLLVKREKLGHY